MSQALYVRIEVPRKNSQGAEALARLKQFCTESGLDYLIVSGQPVGIREKEREIHIDKVRLGLQMARARGVTLGRPRMHTSKIQQIRELRAAGMGLNKIAKLLGVGVPAVCKYTKLPEDSFDALLKNQKQKEMECLQTAKQLQKRLNQLLSKHQLGQLEEDQEL